MSTRAIAVVLVALAGCRDYEHFEKSAADAAVVVLEDAALPADADTPIDASPADAAIDVCATPGPSDLGASPAVPIGSESAISTPIVPSSVAAVRFEGFSDDSFIGIELGSDSHVVRIDHPLSGSPGTSLVSISGNVVAFTAIPVVGDDVHFIVAFSTGTGGMLVEYKWDDTNGILLPVASVTTAYVPLGLGSGDIDQDGHADLLVGAAAVSTMPASLVLYAMHANANFLQQGTTTVPAGVNAFALAAFTQPGGRTLLAALQPGAASAIALFERGSPGDAFTPSAQGIVPSSILSMTVADIDGDGLSDLVFGGEQNVGSTMPPTRQLVAWTGLATGTPGTAMIPVHGAVTGLQRIDWNHDGADDLFLWQEPEASGQQLTPVILQNRGGGLFTELMWATAPSVPGSSAYVSLTSPATQACPPRLIFADTTSAQVSILAP